MSRVVSLVEDELQKAAFKSGVEYAGSEIAQMVQRTTQKHMMARFLAPLLMMGVSAFTAGLALGWLWGTWQ